MECIKEKGFSLNCRFSVNGNIEGITQFKLTTKEDCKVLMEKIKMFGDKESAELRDRNGYIKGCWYEWFRSKREKLAEEYEGKYLLISDFEVKGAYEDSETAFWVGIVTCKEGHFLVQLCTKEEIVHNAITHI